MCKRSCMEPLESSCAEQLGDDAPACAGTSNHQVVAARPASADAEKKKARADEADSSSSGEPTRRPPLAGEDSARERLKRHRTEMAGRVRIPDMWGQERLLKDWVDCSVFDRPLAATRGLLTARDALVAECAAPHRPPLRVQNGCT